MTKYIVTGATGFIGRVLVDKLIENNYYPIIVITRNKENAKDMISSKVSVIEGDVSNYEFIESIIDQNSVIFHLAAYINITNKNKENFYNINYEGTKNIVDVAISKNAKKVIYCSSSSVIHSNDSEIFEPKSFDIKPLIGHYAKSKAMATKYFLEKTKEGLKGIVLYPTLVFGESSIDSEINEIIYKYSQGKFPFYIKGSYNFVFLEDVVNGIIKAYEKGIDGQDYILSGNNLSLKEFFKSINKITGRKRLPFKIPLFIVYLVLPFVSLYYKILRKTPIFTKTSLKILNENTNYNSQKAIKSLDYKVSDLSVSLEKTISYLNHKNK